jgi:hypothetical protein
MFSTLSTPPGKRSVPIDELIIDFVLGWCSPVALLLGSIAMRNPSFLIYAGVFVIPLAHLTMGNLRGESEGNLWLKALCICGAILFLAGTGRVFFVVAGLSVPPTIVGLWLRRRGKLIWRTSRTPNKQ